MQKSEENWKERSNTRSFGSALKSPETRARDSSFGIERIPSVDEVRGNERASSVIRRETVRLGSVVAVRWSNETTIGRVVERAREERPRADRGWWRGPRTTGERTGLSPPRPSPLYHWRRTSSVGANQTHPRFLREDPLPLLTRGPPLLPLVSGRSIRIGIGRGEENFTRNVPLLLSIHLPWMDRM